MNNNENNDTTGAESEEQPTVMEKVGEFLEVNREPIIRGACILIGAAAGFGVSYWLANSEHAVDLDPNDVIEIDEAME